MFAVTRERCLRETRGIATAIRFDITHQDRLAVLQTPVEVPGVQRRQPGTGNVRQISKGPRRRRRSQFAGAANADAEMTCTPSTRSSKCGTSSAARGESVAVDAGAGFDFHQRVRTIASSRFVVQWHMVATSITVDIDYRSPRCSEAESRKPRRSSESSVSSKSGMTAQLAKAVHHEHTDEPTKGQSPGAFCMTVFHRVVVM